jgi:hypothetical protein
LEHCRVSAHCPVAVAQVGAVLLYSENFAGFRLGMRLCYGLAY